MQTTNYTELEIKDLQTKYKRYLHWHTAAHWCAFALSVIVAFLGLNDYFPDTFAFYNSQGIFYFLLNINRMIGGLSSTIILGSWALLTMLFLKYKLKDKYSEFEVARREGNIRNNKWRLIINIFIVIAVLSALILIINTDNSKLNRFTLYEDSIKIQYRSYSDKLNGIYSYDFFDDFDLELSNNKIAFVRNLPLDGKWIFIDLGKPNKYTERLMEVIDEKTDNKHNYLETFQTYEKESL